MKFDIITIFPGIFDSYFNHSILKRAQEKKLLEINVHNLRDYTLDKHQKVDDTPYGGGAGMVMQVQPIFDCVKNIKFEIRNSKSEVNSKSKKVNSKKNRIILFSAKGKRFTQADVKRLAEYEQLILICGRYEGVDERVAEYVADEEISIGDYVLTGGEIPAMVVIDSVSRYVPGVLGNPESLTEESFSNLEAKSYKLEASLEYPQYTKPEEFNGWKVPKVLLGGNHKEIERWREEHRK